MSKTDSGTKESTDTKETVVDAATGGFEVRSEPNNEIRLEVQAIPSLEGGLLALGIRSKHLGGRIFLTPEEAEEIVAATQDAIGELEEFTE